VQLAKKAIHSVVRYEITEARIAQSWNTKPMIADAIVAARQGWGGFLACFFAFALATVVPQCAAQNPDKSIHDPALTALPDANTQMQMHDQQSKAQSFAAANAERKKQIAEDTAKLLKLANDLKSEVEKTNKDTLSLNVIRKADEIERLAHNVKEKMKLTVGGS
jgi:hypothetical protein